MKDLVKKLMDQDYASLQEEIEDLTAKKIALKIKEKKTEVLDSINKKKK